jgi:succinate-acetate transporter protein
MLVPFAVLSTTAVRFALTGVYELTAGHGWMTAAGVVGLALCVIAVFAALAMALEDVLEPGVRPQL